MNSRVIRLALPLAAALWAAGCGPAPDKLAARYTDVVKGYCVDCHDAAGQEGGLTLEGVDLNKVAEHADIFEKVARKLRGRQMPPPGEAQPDDATRLGLADGGMAELSTAPAGPTGWSERCRRRGGRRPICPIGAGARQARWCDSYKIRFA